MNTVEIFGEAGDPLESAHHVGLAEDALGITLVPEVVQEKLRELEVPELDVSWKGALVWRTAYYAGLRQNLAGVRRGPTDRLSRAACNVLMANTFLETDPATLPSASWAEQEGPRANLQQRFAGILGRFLIAPPRPSERTLAGRKTQMEHAVLLVGPAGVGKTLVAGNWLARIGVGAEKPDGTRRKALYITVAQQLIRDLLNPQKTLQRCLPPNVTKTAIWEDSKDAASARGDLVAVTRQSFAAAVEDGLIVREDYDTVIVDEADDLTPELLELVGTFDCPKLLMTATPTHSTQRDLLRDYHFDRPMSRLEAIEKELLAPTRIITLQAESEPQAEHLAALHAARLFVLQGKKAIVYCQPGGGNAQARRIAALTTQYAKEALGKDFNPELAYATMVGSANIDSPEVIAAFEAHEHGAVLTTSQMCGRGWDFTPLAGAIFVGDQGSFSLLDQESSRPGRQSPGKEENQLVEIQLPIRAGAPTRYCLSQVFGLDYVTGADTVLAPGWQRRPAPRPGQGPTPRPTPPAPPPPPSSRGSAGGDPSAGGQQAEGDEAPLAYSAFLASLGLDVTEALVAEGVSIMEIIIEPTRREQYVPPLEYATPDWQLLEANPGISRGYLYYHLGARAGKWAVPFKSIRPLPLSDRPEGEDTRRHTRYYHSELLAARLAIDPLPPVSDTIYSASYMARTLHIPESMALQGIGELGFPPREPSRAPASHVTRGARIVPRYSLEELAALEDWVERIPEASPADEPAVDVLAAHPWALDFLGGDVRVRKRHPRISARKGVDYFFSEEMLWRIEVEHARRNGLVPLTEVATRAGVTQSRLLDALTKEERAFALAHRNKFTPPGGTKNARQVTAEMADAIVARLRARGLGPTEFTAAIYADLMGGITPAVARARLRSLPKTTRTLPGAKGEASVYSIDDLERLAAFDQPPAHIMGLLAVLRAAAAPGATAADRAAARKIQINIFHIPEHTLEPLPDGDREVASPGGVPAPASSAVEKLRAQFEPHALRALIDSVRRRADEVTYGEAGELVGATPALLTRLQMAQKNVTSLTGEWVRLGRLAEMCRYDVDAMYTLVVQDLVRRGHRPQLDGKYFILGRGSDRKVELYVQLRTAQSVRTSVEARRSREA